jgi:hypothetical protein
MMNVPTLTASVLTTNVKSFIAEVNGEKILVFILYFFQGMKYIGARKAFVKVGAITYERINAFALSRECSLKGKAWYNRPPL